MSTTLPERFWSKVDQSGGPDACWPWTAGRQAWGYGAFRVDGETRGAHVMVLEDASGEPANGRHALHSCDNPPCCNPTHLWWGTQVENNTDRQEKKRQARGERAGPAKLTAEQAQAIRERFKPYCHVNGGAALAREFGISQSGVSLLAHGHTWADVGLM